MDTIILHSTSLKDLHAIIGEIIEEKLREFKPEHQIQSTNEFITRREVCSRLKISLATLHSYTKDGILKGYRIGGRVLYRFEEVEAAVQAIQTTKYKHGR